MRRIRMQERERKTEREKHAITRTPLHRFVGREIITIYVRPSRP